MRAVHSKKFSYIFNPWADEKTRFNTKLQNATSFKAMIEAGKDDKNLKARLIFFHYRAKEEFYDYENDHNSLNNLIKHPDYQKSIKAMRAALLNKMRENNDPLLETFIPLVKIPFRNSK